MCVCVCVCVLFDPVKHVLGVIPSGQLKNENKILILTFEFNLISI